MKGKQAYFSALPLWLGKILIYFLGLELELELGLFQEPAFNQQINRFKMYARLEDNKLFDFFDRKNSKIIRIK